MIHTVLILLFILIGSYMLVAYLFKSKNNEDNNVELNIESDSFQTSNTVYNQVSDENVEDSSYSSLVVEEEDAEEEMNVSRDINTEEIDVSDIPELPESDDNDEEPSNTPDTSYNTVEDIQSVVSPDRFDSPDVFNSSEND